MDQIVEFFKNAGRWVSRMTPSQVMMLLGVVAGSVVGIVMVVGWLSSVNYSRLYSDLGEDEAGEVITYLEENKIPYELSDGGRTVSIPSDQVYKTRISLASEGLPHGGTMGYSIFDQNNLGMTDFLQNLNFRRALEGELTRTIMQLNEVKSARVHIVMPKERLFREDQKSATASVVLKLNSSGNLARGQIAGITHLVASSVEGLEPANITIVDYDGNLLSSGSKTDPLAGLSSSQLEVRKQVEDYLQSKSQSMLDDVLGPGKSVVRVTADLNFQQIEKTSETYDPNAPSIRSEERIKSSATSKDKSEETSESSSDDNNETLVTNYELNKTVEHIVNAIGNIDRLSVAVMVDGNYKPAGDGADKGEMIYEPRSQEELDRLAGIVRSAIGFDSQRNDQIEMVNIAFDRQSLEDNQQFLDTMFMWDFYVDLARKIGYFLIAALLFLYLRKKSKKIFAVLGKMVPQAGPSRVVTQTRTVTTTEDGVESEIAPVAQEKREATLVDKMQQTAKGQPEEIAKVIKTMMIE